MPDENKLAKLREIGFRFVKTCATCEHGKQIPHHGEDDAEMRVWGRCAKHRYEHGKHAALRDVPAHALGCCNDHELRTSYLLRFAGGLAGPIPTDGTARRRWTKCESCSWEGWSGALEVHVMACGDDERVDYLCPKCKKNVPTP